MRLDLIMPDDNLANRRGFVDSPLHFTIEPFNLPICLRMLDSGNNMLDSMKIEELLEGMLGYLTFACRYKLSAVVGENLSRDPIPCKSHFKDKDSIPCGGRIENTVTGDQPG
jgi:hypothetical protein